MILLVTGGLGFIGSAVIRQLLADSNNLIINVDNLSYATNIEFIPKSLHSDRYVLEVLDICDKTELDRVFSKYKPQAVMHLAAETHVDRSIDSPSQFIQTNIVGTFMDYQR